MTSNYSLLFPVAILLTLSSLVVASTSLVGDAGNTLVLRHISSMVIGGGAGLILYNIRPNKLLSLGPALLGVSFALLLAVLLIGKSGGGAQRWLSFSGFTFQPSEFTKFAVVVYLSSYIARQKDSLHTFKSALLIPGLIVGATCSLLLMQPDFGSSVIVALLAGAILFLFIPLRLSILGLIAGGSVLAGVMFLSPYRLRRLTAFMDPFADPSGAGYQLIQSLVAVGRGGLSGVGLGMSEQKLSYLPAAHTDFLFAVLSEEFGLIGAVSVVCLYLLIGAWVIRLAIRYKERPAYSALAVGMGCFIVIPAFTNIAVVTGLLPTKGLTLPLMSFGGSSMIMSLVAVFTLLSLARHKECSQ